MDNEHVTNSANYPEGSVNSKNTTKEYGKRGKNILLITKREEYGPFSQTLGRRIINIRATKGLNTTNLAHKAGLAQSHLRDIENGEKNPTVSTIESICKALDISLVEFFDEELENDLIEDEALLTIYRLDTTQKAALSSLLETIPPEKQREGEIITNQNEITKQNAPENSTNSEKHRTPMDIGKRIKSLREIRGLTTTGLAYKAGLAQSHLRDIELGKKNPTLNTVEFICEALNIPLVEFFAEETDGSLKNDKALLAIRQLDDNQRTTLLSFIKAMGDFQ